MQVAIRPRMFLKSDLLPDTQPGLTACVPFNPARPNGARGSRNRTAVRLKQNAFPGSWASKRAMDGKQNHSEKNGITVPRVAIGN